MPKAKPFDESDIAGEATTPVPVNVTTVGDPGALDATFKFADLAPVVVGLKVSATVHVAFADRLEQPVVGRNDDESVPVTVTPDTTTLLAPLFLTVSVVDALVVFTAWFPNAKLEGVTETTGPVTAKVLPTGDAAA